MKRKVLLSLLVALIIVLPISIKAENTTEQYTNNSIDQFTEETYHVVYKEWKEQGLDSSTNFVEAISPVSFIQNENLIDKTKSNGYHSDVFHWDIGDQITFEFDIQEEGLYEVGFDYYPLGDLIIPIEGALQINGEYPFAESRGIIFPVDWKNESNDFEVDRYGNQIVPKQIPIEQWYHYTVHDSNYLYKRPLQFHLKEGKNEITLINLRGEMMIGDAYVTSSQTIPNYKAYVEQFEGESKFSGIQTYEAEYPLQKNNSYIRPEISQNPSVYPYDTKQLYLNSYGGESWNTPGQRIDWEVETEEAGLYELTFKVNQSNESGDPVYRTLMINGKVPFEEVEQYKFIEQKKWYNETLTNDDGEPFLFYLEKGKNIISLQVEGSIYNQVIFKIDQMMKNIEELSLSIRKLTGNQQDRTRDWKIKEYLPNVDQELEEWAKELEVEAEYLKTLSDGKETTSVVSLKIAVKKLQSLASRPDEIPHRLTELSEGSNSAAQMLGTVMTDIQNQPLLIDRFYLHGNEKLPNAEVNIGGKIKNWVVRFIQSFTNDNLATTKVDEDTVDVWVNRPRQYVELLQQMTDQNFTPQTGIKVKYSLMPDEGKLILANASNAQPDLAIGISNWLPYELSIRGAAVNLREFEDFSEVGRRFSPGAFLPLTVDDGIYALPETQDFFVQFYRKDILNSLGIPIPDTWDDVVNILPELQRYGMNYYTPIAGAVAFKPFQTTAPFIYQFGGELYEEDGIGTRIDSDRSLAGIQFMTDLNTIYSTPLQVPSFYNHFRYSMLPIGIAEFGTYVQLTAAANDISGWWDISVYPGIEQEDGSVERWATGSGQSAMIFKGSDNVDNAWELLKWWTSAEIQTEFATTLQTIYGPEYMWNTANLQSFEQLPWPKEHKEVILEQWKYLREVPKTPYAYMVEREISNVWNKVVFDGENTRSAVDDSVITIDREMRRKLEEFGYIENGKVVKPYIIPTIEQIERWLEIDEN